MIGIEMGVPSGSGDSGSLGSLLPDAAIMIGASVADWRDAVRAAGRGLVAAGATTDAYTDEMIVTVETLGPYIVIAPGIALAHSRPSPAVRRAGLSLVTLDPPIPFGHRTNDPVRLVIGLAAPDDEGHVNALATLAEFLADDERRSALLSAGDARTVRSLFASWEDGSPRAAQGASHAVEPA
jgi:PTS system ascorbate-specific IIA component